MINLTWTAPLPGCFPGSVFLYWCKPGMPWLARNIKNNNDNQTQTASQPCWSWSWNCPWTHPIFSCQCRLSLNNKSADFTCLSSIGTPSVSWLHLPVVHWHPKRQLTSLACRPSAPQASVGLLLRVSVYWLENNGWVHGQFSNRKKVYETEVMKIDYIASIPTSNGAKVKAELHLTIWGHTVWWLAILCIVQ